MSSLRVPAIWTDDCQGKKDFDGSLVTLSTRYWPRGGGMHILYGGGRWEENKDRPHIKPHAKAEIFLGSCNNDFYDEAVSLISLDVEGETEEEVKTKVEVWSLEQFTRIYQVLQKEFNTN